LKTLLLGENASTIKNDTEVLLDATREFGLKVNREKTKNMAISRHQIAGQNYILLIYNTLFDNTVKL